MPVVTTVFNGNAFSACPHVAESSVRNTPHLSLENERIYGAPLVRTLLERPIRNRNSQKSRSGICTSSEGKRLRIISSDHGSASAPLATCSANSR